MVKRKRGLIYGMFLLVLVIGIFLIQNSNAQEVSYCCERTVNQAWCQNAPQSECNNNYRSVPTSCEATSYCKTGTCVNTVEGVCLENTPKRQCEGQDGITGGAWYDQDSDEVPLCQLGCCLIGDQAAFVTQTRCQKLSSLYGLEINFQQNIQNEIACIASATPSVKGACVLETQTGRTCKFITKRECQDIQGDFHENFLCSNPDLGADCGMTKQTTCLEGRDEVYFIDSCGNPANVYDSSKVNNVDYWSRVQVSTCGSGSNAGSATCGDCDYYLGSTCKEYNRLTDSGRPKYGDNICRDLSCKYQGTRYEHGETWCATGENPGINDNEFVDLNKPGNLPGSRDFRLVCYNGEVSVEPCADFRQEVCVQSSVEGFSNAACKVNLWRDCYAQDNKNDCENIDKRDCVWVEGVSILRDDNGEELVNDNGVLVQRTEEDYIPYKPGASCVPNYPPGFDFWQEGTDSKDICSMASTTCFVQYEGGKVVEYKETGFWNFLPFGSGRKTGEEVIFCLDNEGNLVTDWVDERKNLCMSLGDCGISKNYIGASGYYDEDDLFKITEPE